MSAIPVVLRNNLALVRSGSVSVLADKLRTRLWSDQTFLAMRRDLTGDIKPPPAPVKFTVRPLEARDIPVLFEGPATPSDIDDRAQRRTWLDAGLPGCHVAVTEDDTPCFMQWVIGPAERDRVEDIFGPLWPGHDSETVLLEGAYTPPRFRRVPLMPAAMARIAETGRATGARWAILYTGDDNASMIKAARWAGFAPHLTVNLKRRLFARRIDAGPNRRDAPPAAS